MKKNKIVNIIKIIIYYAIPIGLFLWCSQVIFNNSIWLDEAFSLSMIEQSFVDMIKNTAIDVHPPLYYVILKSFTAIFKFFFGGNIIWTTKFVSLIPIIILLVVNYTEIEKLFGKKTSFLFAIFILGMPQIMKYAIEIRMYSWGMLFVTMVYLYCIKWLQTDKIKEITIMTIFTVLSAYTHYFAAVSVGCIYLCILIYLILQKDISKIKKIILSGIVVVLAYLPWIIILLKQVLVVKSNYWIDNITLKTIKEFFMFPYKVVGNRLLTFAIGVLLIINIILLVIKRKEKYSKYAICGVLVPIGTIIIGIIASKLIRPVFISRYMVCGLGCFWLAIAIILGKNLNKKYIFSTLAILLTITSIYNTQKLLKQEKNYSKEIINSVNYINEINTEPITIVFDSNQLQRMVAYYYPNVETYVYKEEITNLTKQVYKQTNMQILEELNDLREIKDKPIYLCVMKEEILNDIKNQGFEYNKCGNFQIETYKFSVYEIW